MVRTDVELIEQLSSLSLCVCVYYYININKDRALFKLRTFIIANGKLHFPYNNNNVLISIIN